MAVTNGEFPIDAQSDVGFIRLLISDTEPLPITGSADEEFILPDSQIAAAYSRFNSHYRTAAALLRTMATSAVIIQGNIRNDEISTNGSTSANALRLLAVDYDKRADEEDADSVDAFDIVDPFADNIIPEGIPAYGPYRWVRQSWR